MAKMPVATFVKNVRSYIGRPYSEIDCAELLYLASNKAICRGSNSQWRKEIGEHGRITDGKPSDPYPAGNDRKSSQLQVGMAVFMHKAKDTAKYPDGQGDYSHVGVVTSVNPLRITNSSSVQGKVTDYTRIGTFCAWGYLKDIDYGKSTQTQPTTGTTTKEEAPMAVNAWRIKCKVASLRIRQAPSTDSPRIGNLKLGDVVYAYAKEGKWFKLNEGYVHGDYVTVLSEPTEAEQQKPADEKPADAAECRCAQLEARIAALEAKVTQLFDQLAKEVGDDE